MKKIFLIRHAKSDWEIPGIDDIDRPLNERGYRDAHFIGRKLKSELKANVIFISSPAIRAMSTALIIAHETGYPKDRIMIYPKLYEAKVAIYSDVLFSIDEVYDTAFIFGHNPGISEAVQELGKGPICDLPPCSVTCIGFETADWTTVPGSQSSIILQLSPKSQVG